MDDPEASGDAETPRDTPMHSEAPRCDFPRGLLRVQSVDFLREAPRPREQVKPRTDAPAAGAGLSAVVAAGLPAHAEAETTVADDWLRACREEILRSRAGGGAD